MEVRASARFQRLSPRKARLVTDLITGKSAEEAIAILENLSSSTALPLGRVVRRAIANEGPRMKRAWFRGRGRRDLKVHRLAHLEVVLDSRE
ncbi:MAG: 50S ribosomal protein L22 [Chloroflexi bacterium]|nr:MAG: 50S ribosomal protein L22 [Chloroflexota bacterium]